MSHVLEGVHSSQSDGYFFSTYLADFSITNLCYPLSIYTSNTYTDFITLKICCRSHNALVYIDLCRKKHVTWHVTFMAQITKYGILKDLRWCICNIPNVALLIFLSHYVITGFTHNSFYHNLFCYRKSVGWGTLDIAFFTHDRF